MSDETEFAHLFPEWELAYSLAKGCKVDPKPLWKQEAVNLVSASTELRTLEQIYGTPEALSLHHEKWLPKDGAKLTASTQTSTQKPSTAWCPTSESNRRIIHSLCYSKPKARGLRQPLGGLGDIRF